MSVTTKAKRKSSLASSNENLIATPIKVIHQGAVIVNHAIICNAGKDICAVIVDLKTKRAEIDCIGFDDGIPTLCIDPCLYSLRRSTEIAFLDFTGWTIWSAMVCKYSVYVCLIKK